ARLAVAEDQRLPVIQVHDVLALTESDQWVAVSHQRVARHVGGIALRYVVGIRSGPTGIRGRLSIGGRCAWLRPRRGPRTRDGWKVSVLVRAVVTSGTSAPLRGAVGPRPGGGRGPRT